MIRMLYEVQRLSGYVNVWTGVLYEALKVSVYNTIWLGCFMKHWGYWLCITINTLNFVTSLPV